MIDPNKLFAEVSKTFLAISDEVKHFADRDDPILFIREFRDGSRERGIYVDNHFIPLSGDQIAALAGLQRQAEAMVDRESFPTFEVREWLLQWVCTPQPALSGKTPVDQLGTEEGRELMASLLGGMAGLIYM